MYILSIVWPKISMGVFVEIVNKNNKKIFHNAPTKIATKEFSTNLHLMSCMVATQSCGITLTFLTQSVLHDLLLCEKIASLIMGLSHLPAIMLALPLRCETRKARGNTQ